MVLRSVIGRLAAGADARVFAVAGSGASEAVQDLRLADGLRLVDTPRAADVLLVAGGIPPALAEPLARVHDALAHPRATVFWMPGVPPPDLVAALSAPIIVTDDDGIVPAVRRAHRELMTGDRVSEPPVLPDEDAAPWRGVGPYGQGGSGMTGGTPYGRPMAELGADRDGLRLDVLPLSVGPFFPRFPSGLILDLKLAGDVVVEAAARDNPFAEEARRPTPGLQPFLRALSQPVAIAELEVARARHHLRWLADALLAHQLGSLGVRVLRLATTLTPDDAETIERFAKTLTFTQVLRWSTGGAGRLSPDLLAGLGAGPVARASGLAEDARMDDASYGALGFEPIALVEGDTATRWRLRLAEAIQSLDLAGRAGDLRTEQVGRVEGPRGTLEPGSSPTERLMAIVPRFIEGLEWGDAVAVLTSLDLSWDEAAAARVPAAAQGVA